MADPNHHHDHDHSGHGDHGHGADHGHGDQDRGHKGPPRGTPHPTLPLKGGGLSGQGTAVGGQADHDHDGHGPDGHDHGDEEGHDHAHGRGHVHAANAGNEKRVLWAAVLTATLMLVEIAGGIVAGSLALVADAGHMLTDAAGLFIAWLAFRIARRPADPRRTFGFARFQVLAAFGNGLFLLGIAAFILIEAVRRLFMPVAVDWLPMLIVASVGLVANIGAYFILHGGDRSSLNMRGAILHVLGDLLGSAGAVMAALIIMATGWVAADPILSAFVTLLIVVSAVRLIRESAHILLEGTPENLSIAEIAADLPANVTGIDSVHDVHAWSIAEGQPMITLHACVADGVPADDAIARVKRRLRERYGIRHATIEVERGVCADAGVAAHG